MGGVDLGHLPPAAAGARGLLAHVRARAVDERAGQRGHPRRHGDGRLERGQRHGDKPAHPLRIAGPGRRRGPQAVAALRRLRAAQRRQLEGPDRERAVAVGGHEAVERHEATERARRAGPRAAAGPCPHRSGRRARRRRGPAATGPPRPRASPASGPPRGRGPERASDARAHAAPAAPGPRPMLPRMPCGSGRGRPRRGAGYRASGRPPHPGRKRPASPICPPPKRRAR